MKNKFLKPILFLIVWLPASALWAANETGDNELLKACESGPKNSQTKKDQSGVCECIVRNHQINSDSKELAILARKYRGTLTPEDHRKESVDLLFEFDLKIARACLKDPKYRIQKSSP